MTREQLLAALDNALTILQNVYNPAIVVGIIDKEQASEFRGGMYALQGVRESVRRDGQLRDLIESAK